jgi:hypothetical protein
LAGFRVRSSVVEHLTFKKRRWHFVALKLLSYSKNSMVVMGLKGPISASVCAS